MSSSAIAAGSQAAAQPEPEAVPPVAPSVISVKQMGGDFEVNQIAAERRWGGISGVSFHEVTTEFSFTQVSCDLKDEDVLETLTKGEPVTVRGVVGDDQMLGVIGLDQCEVVRDRPDR